VFVACPLSSSSPSLLLPISTPRAVARGSSSGCCCAGRHGIVWLQGGQRRCGGVTGGCRVHTRRVSPCRGLPAPFVLLSALRSLSFILHCCPLSFIVHCLSFIVCPLSSLFPSSVLCPLSFVLCPLSFVLCPLSSIVRPLCLLFVVCCLLFLILSLSFILCVPYSLFIVRCSLSVFRGAWCWERATSCGVLSLAVVWGHFII
jgi:hypothetical protein